jgi:hypothetical protein
MFDLWVENETSYLRKEADSLKSAYSIEIHELKEICYAKQLKNLKF